MITPDFISMNYDKLYGEKSISSYFIAVNALGSFLSQVRQLLTFSNFVTEILRQIGLQNKQGSESKTTSSPRSFEVVTLAISKSLMKCLTLKTKVGGVICQYFLLEYDAIRILKLLASFF